jgi:hypothetical protein
MKTIVSQHKDEMLKDHVEPERAGLARGDQVGYPRVKKATAHDLAITQREKKQVAREHGISYSVLRKWETEAAFKKQMQDYIDSFGDFAAAAMLAREIALEEWAEPLAPKAWWSLQQSLKEKLAKRNASALGDITKRVAILDKANPQDRPAPRLKKWIVKREPNKSHIEQENTMMKFNNESGDPIGDILYDLRKELYSQVEKYIETPEAKQALQTLQETDRRPTTANKQKAA